MTPAKMLTRVTRIDHTDSRVIKREIDFPEKAEDVVKDFITHGWDLVDIETRDSVVMVYGAARVRISRIKVNAIPERNTAEGEQ